MKLPARGECKIWVWTPRSSFFSRRRPAPLPTPRDEAQAASPGRRLFRRTATAVAHLCGLILRGKRYIERSPLVQWAILELQKQMNIRGDFLFNIRDYSKEKVQNKDFERLIHLLRICPNERTPEDILQETCLLTNTRRLASVICKSDTELLVIDKKAFECALASIRKLPLFSTWPSEKIDFIIHCSLQRLYRAGTTVITDSLNSYFIVIVKSGRCTETARLDQRTINTQDATWKITPKCKLEKQGPKVASLAPRLLKIRTLEQGDIFGLANLMDKSCVLQLILISEGTECIFIPKRLFLEEATAKSRQMALQMFSSYPTESTIQESYNLQQAWNRYKSKLIKQHLKWHQK